MLWGYFISSECYFSEATEAFDLIRLIRRGWVATWLVLHVCVWEISPSGASPIGFRRAEQKMYLLLLWLQANHDVYLRYCPAGRITNLCELDVILLFHCREETLFKHAREQRQRPKQGYDRRCHLGWLVGDMNAIILPWKTQSGMKCGNRSKKKDTTVHIVHDNALMRKNAFLTLVRNNLAGLYRALTSNAFQLKLRCWMRLRSRCWCCQALRWFILDARD